jgi:hypothetical protein
MSTINPNYNTPANSTELDPLKPVEHPEIVETDLETSKARDEAVESNNAAESTVEGLHAELTEEEKKSALGAIIGGPDTAGKIMNASAAGRDPKEVIADIYQSPDLTPHQVLEKGEDPSNIVEGLYGKPTK